MSPLDIVRAWKSEEVRNNMTAGQRASLPTNPAGLIELTEAQLEIVAGGAANIPTKASGCRATKNGECGTGRTCTKTGMCRKL